MVKRVMVLENAHSEENVKGSSDRAFGIVFTVVFVIIGFWPLLDGAPVRTWSLVVGLIFLILGMMWPHSLTKLNHLWLRLGILLNRIVSPIALGIVFFLTVFPTGLVMRLLGKDLLRLKFDPHAKTYWIDRNPPGPDPKTMSNQF